ncbi:MAG: nitrogen fixation protein FixH [Comamonadaceae bacterium]|nr:MAG: nitrogen fixation protein FixH [Comamonadaceae bacterium]
MNNAKTQNTDPWWKFGHVWLVVSGPAIVVAASFITFYLAYSGMDTLVDENYYQKGLEINRTLMGDKPSSLAPAQQARNHAATGVIPNTKQK